MAINFGTDGWRAVISEEFTFDNVRKVAQAIAEKTLADEWRQRQAGQRRGPPAVAGRGFDTRFSATAMPWPRPKCWQPTASTWLAHSDSPTPMTSYAIVRQAGRRRRHDHGQPQPAAPLNGIKPGCVYGSASPVDRKRSRAAYRRAPAMPGHSAWRGEAAAAQG